MTIVMELERNNLRNAFFNSNEIMEQRVESFKYSVKIESSYFAAGTKYKVKRYSIICENFESKYGFISGELKAKFETGNIGEESDFFDWYAAKRGLDHWSKKLEILSDISIKE